MSSSTTEASRPEILPYLNPAYWDGHMIGYDCALNPIQTDYSPPANREARRVIREKLSLSVSTLALEQFKEGASFDPSVQPPGTLLLFREEWLFGTAPSEDMLHAALEMDIPYRPLSATLRPIDNIALSTGDINYRSRLMFGVVTHHKKRPGIVAIPVDSAMKPDGSYKHPASSFTYLANHTIGMTHHIRNEKSDWMKRTNFLDILQYGKTKKAKQKSALGRFAFNHH